MSFESALEAAKLAETEIQQGQWKDPLHGIPVGTKDFYDTAGVRTTAAFEHFRNRVPEKDAASVVKLKKAGAIVIGKTNMHTLGAGTTGLESCFGAGQESLEFGIYSWRIDERLGGRGCVRDCAMRRSGYRPHAAA